MKEVKHLNFALSLDQYKIANEVKEGMNAESWGECFMTLINSAKKREEEYGAE